MFSLNKIKTFSVLFLCFVLRALESAPLSPWLCDEIEAISTIQATQKPMIIAFLGDGWCPWSNKFAQEILDKPEFFEALKKDAVLLHVPLKQNMSTHLQELLHVDRPATLLITDSNGEEIGRFGFLPIAPKDYARRILHLIRCFNEIKAFMDSPPLQYDEEAYQLIYRKSQKLSTPFYKKKIIQMGIEKGNSSFFLLEKYCTLLEVLSPKHVLVKSLRQEILKKEPEMQLDLAMIEFQKLGAAVRLGEDLKTSIEPLLAYVKQFGGKNKEGVSRAEIAMAQYLFMKNDTDGALIHAEKAYAAGAGRVKAEAKSLISHLKALKQ